jgi:TRAP-type uncharacterized transport system substrate-binding protein
MSREIERFYARLELVSITGKKIFLEEEEYTDYFSLKQVIEERNLSPADIEMEEDVGNIFLKIKNLNKEA